MAPRFYAALLALAVLTACSSAPKETSGIVGQRVAVLPPAADVQVDAAEAATPLNLPSAVENQSWPQSMGQVDAPMGMLEFSRAPQRVWHASVGSGSDDTAVLLARPVIDGGKVFTIDTAAQISAFDVQTGDMLWRTDLTPSEAEAEMFGGGVAVVDGKVFASTGYGTLAALDAATGAVQWRTELPEIFRGAPAVVNGRVLAVSLDSQTYALNAATGQQLWVHAGINQPSTLLGTAVPVAVGDAAIVPYSSGELYGVRLANGRTVWQQSLAGGRVAGALPVMSDIRASPAVDADRAYAISNGGRMVAVDLRTGNVVWEADLGSINTPMLAGDAVFVLTSQNQLLTLDKTNGAVRAKISLPRYEDEDAQRKPIQWAGPVLAAEALWVVGTNEELRAYDVNSGEQIFVADLPDKTHLAPVLAAGTLVVLSDDSTLTAYR